MEYQFSNFQTEYQTYQNNMPNIKRLFFNDATRTPRIVAIHNEFENLDVKMRLAFGISEIKLNNEFVSDKQGDLKDCHLLYYKLADLWFAYETYIKLYACVTGTSKQKIAWLDAAVHTSYAGSQPIIRALDHAIGKFTGTFSSALLGHEFNEYLHYCMQQATNQQRTRLGIIIAKVVQRNFVFTHGEVLTIIYAMRNNFVHNGETTVVPAIFGYKNKSKLLRILYPYLCLVLLASTNITCGKI